MSELERVKQRIRALRARAGGTSNLHEAAAAAGIAAELIAKYRLDEVEIAEVENRESTIVEAADCIKFWHRWELKVACRVASHVGVAVFYRQRTSEDPGKVTLVGVQSDIVLAQTLHSYLKREISRLLRSADNRPGYRYHFARGALSTVLRAMQRADENVIVTTGQTRAALVLRTRYQKARERLDELHPDLTDGKPERDMTVSEKMAYGHGVVAGKTIDPNGHVARLKAAGR